MTRRMRLVGLVGAPLVAFTIAGAIWAATGSTSDAEPATPNWSGEPAEVAAALDERAWHDPGADALQIGDGPLQPALEFPAGTTYADALVAIYASSARGELPEEARLREPLPLGKVVRAGSDGLGVAISLEAPFGYDVFTGNVVTPIFEQSDPSGPTPSDAAIRKLWDSSGEVIPPGFRVAGSALADCQVDAPGMPAKCSASSLTGTLEVIEVEGGIGPVVTGGRS